LVDYATLFVEEKKRVENKVKIALSNRNYDRI
jgi:hypothetical protein